MRTLTTLLCLAALATPAVAQQAEIREANLPRTLETRLLRMFDAEGARVDGAVTIGAGEVRRGDIAAYQGPLRIGGRVEGDVAMVAGDVVLEAGSEVTGSITVVGGQVRMADDAVVGGTITAYGPALAGVEREGRWADRDRRPRRASRSSEAGYSRLTLRTGVSYNRVEGLPVMFGPVLETAGPLPLRLEAFGIWRSEAGSSVETERFGYRVAAEQFLVRDRALGVGGSVYSVVEPMDRWQVRDLEASLATALFHQDPRDHFERTGWSVFARARPARGVEGRITFRDERHATVPAADPWALFNRSDGWRLQPLVAEGGVQTLGGSLDVDRRDRGDDPRVGWLVRVSVDRPVGGSLAMPRLGPTPLSGDDPVDRDFTLGFLDVRRYSPVGHRSQLNLRAVAGGALTERWIPPQYQHALGGPGTLPGYPLFHGDCGARGLVGAHRGEPFFGGYGCDRFALAQAEYRGDLSLDFGLGDWHHSSDWWRGVDIHARPAWIMFANVGRGWAYGDPAQPRGTASDTGTLVDAGIGFLIGKLGVYAAVPLRGELDQSPRFMLRWGPRF